MSANPIDHADAFDTYLPIDIDDAELERILEKAELPALLAALAKLTGDTSLVPPSLKPPHTRKSFIPMPQGGLDEAQQKEARRLAFDAIRRYRDGEIQTPGHTDDAELRAIVSFLITRDFDDYRDLLIHEVADHDVGAPRWTLSELDPDRPFKVLIIGAGITGVVAAYRLKQAGVEHVVLEKNPEIGGTWWENTYPGCRLDTSNYAYSFSFAQKTDWPQKFSRQSEIQDYVLKVAHDYGVRDRIVFNTLVRSVIYDEEAGEWEVTAVTDGEVRVHRANVVISGTGQLNSPKLPNIEGMDSFAGASMHSARWNHDVSLKGKRVAIIGTGASAYQIAPAIADEVGKLEVFQRSAPWLLPTADYLDDISPELMWLFRHIPGYARWYRFWQFWLATEGRMPTVTADEGWSEEGSIGAINHAFRQELEAEFRRQLADRPDLIDKVIPTYPAGAKRLLRDNGQWSATLRKPHVDLVTEGIERIVPEGVVTADGVLHEVDVIAYATGFRADEFLADMEVRGRDGVEVHEYWDGDPRAYATMTVPGFPNFFICGGPNSAVAANGSAIFIVECSIEYILECIRTLVVKRLKDMEPTDAATDAFVGKIDRANRARAWGAEGVTSWYRNKTGRVSAVWPFELLEFWNMTRGPAEGDYRFTPLGELTTQAAE
ncbi:MULTISPECIES: flavin-containing monooxygenase [Sphingomonadales]|uniref:NAD(P)/FAD-dependent oxidoreductase n=2 Tax=Sphingomonadaceae TaxID=41297 RepID=A0A2S8AZY7_9SPHN|nr:MULTISPECIES: NAD(P)/FAD-dependent oxidoreductase [Sphingomonadaceae]AGH51662.1 putative flavin-containing monooxygenase [Sphingomonas sp. MM-1]AMK20312.1 putative flavin-containing monooxygenase [Sphingobium sp. MI1205]EQB00536.1 monooxygenase [Sphingobium baderi LL03]KMS61739.1 monooxygenase [Sphingobium baderi LL03]PQM25701.1 NAD(P)/FAD-dependent oxidoreductase [Sphingopyxis lindanitolerans]